MSAETTEIICPCAPGMLTGVSGGTVGETTVDTPGGVTSVDVNEATGDTVGAAEVPLRRGEVGEVK